MASLETDISGFDRVKCFSDQTSDRIEAQIKKELVEPGPDRILFIGEAFRKNFTLESVLTLSRIDPWFLAQIRDLIDEELGLITLKKLSNLSQTHLQRLKRKGFSDKRIATILSEFGITCNENQLRQYRHSLGIHPVFKRIDSCAAEFSTETAYLYSTYEQFCEAKPSNRKKIVILGSGPNRIGQGIEFDYCCVHTATAMREACFELKAL